MRAMEEVAEGIFRICEESRFRVIRPPVNVYIISGHDGIIFDAGYGTKGAIKFFIKEYYTIARFLKDRGLPFNVTRILPSHAHPDHFSGIVKLCKALNLQVIVTKSMFKILCSRDAYRSSYAVNSAIFHQIENPHWQKFKMLTVGKALSYMYEKFYGTKFIPNPDIVLEDNDEITINGECWQIIHSPGHSTDHISLYNEKRGILFAGDNILRSITTWLGPPKSNLRDYLSTLDRLQRLPNLKLILSAHGSPITNPRERIQEIINWRHERTLQVLHLIQSRGNMGITLREILKKLYEKESWIKHRMAEGWIIVTLQYLEEEKLISHRIEGTDVIFVPNEGAPL